MATVCEASPVSLSYFAANITVLFAVGALADMISEVSSVPLSPKSLNRPRHMQGMSISFTSATVRIRHSLSAALAFVFAR